MSVSILIVDDEPQIITVIKKMLDSYAYEVTTAGDVKSACRELARKKFQVAMIDLMLPDASGLDLLQYVRAVQPECRCIIMTGFSTTKTVVQAIQLGSYDYIEKPFKSLTHITNLIKKAAGLHDVDQESSDWDSIQYYADQVGMVIGRNKKIRKLITTAYKIADKKISVLITGETGTGKEMLARFIHTAGNRSNNVFIPVNCGAIHESLLESELFGHEKGAFTGASTTRKGIFELADKGTLFLDELAEASHAIQVKLLRVLETGEFLRVGGEKPISTDVRIIAATNANIEKLLQEKKFREDLFYRLDVVRLELLPLKDRIEDIADLANYFIQKNTRHMGFARSPVFSEKALQVLTAYPWHGNIRELNNVVQQIVAKDSQEIIDVKHLPPKVIESAGNSISNNDHYPHKERELLIKLERITNRLELISSMSVNNKSSFQPRTLREVEEEHIKKTLAHYGGNISLAAKALGLSRATLYRKIKH